MTRELKLALIVGFSVMLLVTVLISDHLSRGRKAQTQAQLPEQPPVVVAAEAPKQPEPFVTITQGTLGGVTETPTTMASGTQSLDPTLADELARRAGAVINGDAAMPAQLETTPLPLGQNLLPPIRTQDMTMPRTGGAMAQVPMNDSTTSGLTPSQPLREQGPDSASLSGGGTGMLPAAIVRDGELRLSDATPAPTNEGALATNSPEVKPAQQLATKPDSKPAAEDRWHTVANGDSAYSIAKRYYGNGEAWKALAKYNKDRIGANGAVRVGVRVRIPEASVLGLKTASKTDSKTESKADARAVERSLIAKPDAKPTAKPEASKPDAAKAPAKKGNTYTVKAGDSLARIAQQQLGTTKRMQEILKLNPGIKDADDIRAGMTLQMPTK